MFNPPKIEKKLKYIYYFNCEQQLTFKFCIGSSGLSEIKVIFSDHWILFVNHILSEVKFYWAMIKVDGLATGVLWKEV